MSITQFTEALPSADDPATFDARANALMLWLTASFAPEVKLAAEGISAALAGAGDLPEAVAQLQDVAAGLGDMATLDAADLAKTDAEWLEGAEAGPAMISPAQLRVAARPVIRSPSMSLAGSYVDFTGIPETATRVEITLSGASLSSTGRVAVRLGTSNGIVDGGYAAAASMNGNSGATAALSSATEIPVSAEASAGASLTGTMILTALGGGLWAGSGFFIDATAPRGGGGGGSVTLAGDLSQVRILASAGTFDGGTAIVAWQ